MQEIAARDIEGPLIQPHRQDRALGGEFFLQRLLEVIEHAKSAAVDLQRSLRARARVPGEVGLGSAAELERHVPEGEVSRAQQLQAGAKQIREIRVTKPAHELAQPLRAGAADSLDQDLQRPEDQVLHGRRCRSRVPLGIQKPDPPVGRAHSVQPLRHARVVTPVRNRRPRLVWLVGICHEQRPYDVRARRAMHFSCAADLALRAVRRGGRPCTESGRG